MDLKALSYKVSERRKNLGLSQQTLAEKAGVSRPYISLIERGEAENVSPKVLSRLAAALDTTPAVLLGEFDQPDRVNRIIPHELAAFAMKEGLSYEFVDRLVRIPKPGYEPQSIEGWEKLYKAVREYLGAIG